MIRSFQLTGEGGFRDSIPPDQVAVAVSIAGEANAIGFNVKPGDMVRIEGNVAGEPVNIAKNVCVRAVGDVFSLPTEGSRDLRYRSVSVFIPDTDEDINKFLFNVNASGNKVTLAIKGPCIPSLKPLISDKAKIRPEKPVAPARSATNANTSEAEAEP
jgi:hypothetical protein